MRQDGADTGIPGSTRCSLTLQSFGHTITTHAMRAVDYVTNGFGGPIPTLNPAQQQSIQPYVESAVSGYGVPLAVVKAAVRTYYQFGPSGFRRTLAFVDAIEDADGALERMFPNLRNQLRGPMAGLAYKRAFNGLLNTAASRSGLTPLSSELVQTIRERLNRIPDSSTSPESQFNQMIPSYILSMRTWVGHLASGVS